MIAIAIRFEVVRELNNNDILSNNPPVGTDMYRYWEMSGKIFEGTFDGHFYFQPFYYVVFLPSVYFILGKGIWQVLLVQVFLGGITVFLTGLTGAMIGGKRSGLIAAFLMAFAFLPIFYTSYLLIVTMKTLFMILLLYSFLLSLRYNKIYLFCWTGFVFSILVLLRANTFIFLPVLLFFCTWNALIKLHIESIHDFKKKWFKVLTPSLFFVIFIVIGLLPFCIYNSLEVGKISGPTVGVGSLHFILGNNPEAAPGGILYSSTTKYWNAIKDSKPLLKSFFEWITAAPSAYMDLLIRKFLLFWDLTDITNNIRDISGSSEQSPMLRLSIFLPSSLFLIPFFSLLVFYSKRILKKKSILLIFLMILSYCFSVVLFMNLARYRVAIFPLFSIMSAVFINAFFLKAHRKKPIRIMLGLLTGVFFVVFAFPLYSNIIGKKALAIMQPEGNVITLGNKTIYMDNGPNFLGSHTPVILKPGEELVKSFALKKKYPGKVVKLQMPVVCWGKHNIRIKINNRVFYIKGNLYHPSFSADNQKKSIVSFSIPFPEDGSFHIENIETNENSGVLFYLDNQRSYGRTIWENRKLDGELVSRLIVDEE